MNTGVDHVVGAIVPISHVCNKGGGCGCYVSCTTPVYRGTNKSVSNHR